MEQSLQITSMYSLNVGRYTAWNTSRLRPRAISGCHKHTQPAGYGYVSVEQYTITDDIIQDDICDL